MYYVPVSMFWVECARACPPTGQSESERKSACVNRSRTEKGRSIRTRGIGADTLGRNVAVYVLFDLGIVCPHVSTGFWMKHESGLRVTRQKTN